MENNAVITKDIVKIGSKAVIGASVGVAAGMILVAGAAIEGPLLSYVLFTKVLGLAGGAAGAAHGVSKIVEDNKVKK